MNFGPFLIQFERFTLAQDLVKYSNKNSKKKDSLTLFQSHHGEGRLKKYEKQVFLLTYNLLLNGV